MKPFFKVLAALNKIILPRMSRRDLAHLSRIHKAIAAYRYWVTKNAL